ncbi:MAG TPA: serine hydrolase, partial [Rudaea sp.]|nr:serine hydrolase [Rudaea sp.]
MKRLHYFAFAALFAFSTLASPLAAAPHKHKKAAQPATQPAEPATPKPAEVPTPNPTPRAAPGALNVPTPPPPTLDAKSWVLMDYATGQILAQNNADERVEPASITKMMTGYIVSAELAAGKIKLEDPVLISERAWREGGAGTDGSTT